MVGTMSWGDLRFDAIQTCAFARVELRLHVVFCFVFLNLLPARVGFPRFLDSAALLLRLRSVQNTLDGPG